MGLNRLDFTFPPHLTHFNRPPVNFIRFPGTKLGGLVSLRCQWLADLNTSRFNFSSLGQTPPSRRTTALVVPEVNAKFELREVYLDAIQPDEVLVEIHASGLCHTDLSAAIGVLSCEPVLFSS
jgi:hypothetical protein